MEDKPTMKHVPVCDACGGTGWIRRRAPAAPETDDNSYFTSRCPCCTKSAKRQSQEEVREETQAYKALRTRRAWGNNRYG